MTRKAPPEKPADHPDWGFDDKPAGLKLDTKLGLALVFCLIAGFSFVLHQKWSVLQRQIAGTADGSGEMHAATDVNPVGTTPPTFAIPADLQRTAEVTDAPKSVAANVTNAMADDGWNLSSAQSVAPATQSQSSDDPFASLPVQEERSADVDPFSTDPTQKSADVTSFPAASDANPFVSTPSTSAMDANVAPSQDSADVSGFAFVTPAETTFEPPVNHPEQSGPSLEQPAQELPEFGDLSATDTTPSETEETDQGFVMDLGPSHEVSEAVEPYVTRSPEPAHSVTKSSSVPVDDANPFSQPAGGPEAPQVVQETIELFPAERETPREDPHPLEGPSISEGFANEPVATEPAPLDPAWQSPPSLPAHEPARLSSTVSDALPTWESPDAVGVDSATTPRQEDPDMIANSEPMITDTDEGLATLGPMESVMSEQVRVVGRSDSFWSISQEMYGTGRYFSALAQYNADLVTDPSKLPLGTRLKVPPPEVLEAQFPQMFVRREPHSFPITPAGGPRNADSQLPSGLFLNHERQPIYRVGGDDTLSEIARRHLGRASRWQEILDLNRDRLQNPQDLPIGMILRLPADASQVPLSPGLPSSR